MVSSNSSPYLITSSTSTYSPLSTFIKEKILESLSSPSYELKNDAEKLKLENDVEELSKLQINKSY